MDSVTNPTQQFSKQLAEAALGSGESSAIALALENEGSLLIIDEQKGRRIAQSLGVQITGTLGVVAQAKLQGHIQAALPVIQKSGKPISG